jgi:UDP-N-acetylmuramate dehydrogenase
VTELTDASSLSRAEAILRAACGDRVRTSFSLAPLTTFRIGGPAALYLEPHAEPDLAAVASAASKTGVPVVVIGKGSNVLVADEGFPGIVIRLGRGYRWAARDGDRLTAGGAMPLPALAGVALSHGLSGLEFGVAIPATLGGAVRMNAGAHGHEMATALEWIDLFDLEGGRSERISREEAGFDYRGSGLPSRGVVVGATAHLVPDEPDAIRTRMDEAREWRRRTQPLAEPNCGSVFKNPPGGHAARLIEEAGGKELSVGAAAVSAKHANFIVAGRDARAEDVLELIRNVQEVVAARFDIRLDTEVQLVGIYDGDG